MECKLCQVNCDFDPKPVETGATGVCSDCRDKLGIIPMPPSRRLARPCAHCNASRFVRVVPRELAANVGKYLVTFAGPMTATLVPVTTERLIFQGRDVDKPSPGAGVGILEMYICTGCGLVEWHCLDPEEIPIGPEYMTEIVDHAPTSAYR